MLKKYNIVFLSSILGTLDFIVNIGISIVTVPIFLTFWTKDKYGLWLVLLASISIFQFFDASYRTYIGYELNLTYKANKEKAYHLLASSLFFVFILGIIPFLFFFILYGSTYISEFFFGITNNLISEQNLIECLVILQISNLIGASPAGLINSTFFPKNLLIDAQILGIATSILRFLLLLFLAFANKTILQTSFIYAIAQILITVFTLFLIKRKVPEFYPWWKGASLITGFKAFKKSILLTINNLINQASSNGLILIVNSFYGAMSVTAFSTLRTISNVGTKISAIISTSTYLQLIDAHAKSNYDKVSEIIKFNFFVIGFIYNVTFMLFDPIMNYFYSLWTNGKVVFDVSLFHLLIISSGLFNFSYILFQYISGINDLKSQNRVVLLKSVTLFITLFFLIHSTGLLSLGYAIIFSELVGVIYLCRTLYIYLPTDFIPLKELFFFFIPYLLLIVYYCLFSIWGFNTFIYGLFSFLVLSACLYNLKFLGEDTKYRLKKLFAKFTPGVNK